MVRHPDVVDRHRIISFLTAFGLEALLYGSKWAQISTGSVLGVVVLLVIWCASARTETPFNLWARARTLKGGLVNFARSFRGTASEPGPDAEDAGAGDGHGRTGVLSQSGIFTKAFNRLRSPRRLRGSTPPVPVNGAGEDGHRPPDVTAVEMGEVNNDALRGAV